MYYINRMWTKIYNHFNKCRKDICPSSKHFHYEMLNKLGIEINLNTIETLDDKTMNDTI